MTPQQLYGQAMTLHQRGRLTEAEALYRRLLAREPQAFAALHMLGVLSAQQGRTAEALDLIGRAVAINPRDSNAWVNYGNVLNLSGRFEEAVASYDRALAMAPDAGTLTVYALMDYPSLAGAYRFSITPAAIMLPWKS